MKIFKQYLITLFITAAFLAVIYGISKYYGEEMAVPVISYSSAEVKAEDVISPNAVDINSASAEELETLEGIGPATAGKIVSYREKYGYFRSTDELTEVDGIGEGKLAAIKDMIYVSYIVPDKMTVSETETQTSADAPDIPTDRAVPAETETPQPALTEADIKDVYPININTASEEELMLLDGVGEVIAGRIREYAETTGFDTVDDLINVKGIGEKKLESIRPYVTV